MVLSSLCPCHSGMQYDSCCKPLLSGHSEATTAEQLMRSRFSAFYYSNVDYLVRTLHPSKRADDERDQLCRSMTQVQWINLLILDAVDGNTFHSTGIVEFVARYLEKDQPGALRERSNFVKENNLWFYLDGEIKPPPQLGRNNPCWCGSGKKLKKCHQQ